jgi:DNA-binding transcriptional MerR regulator
MPLDGDLMSEKQYSTGEAAKISGLTIRTLQHYDNIGVLPASGRTEGGRRYYTEKDMVKLEHVVFCRGLGFSLEQIKTRLMDESLSGNVIELLENQKLALYTHISSIQNSVAAIEASQEIIAAGATPPWMTLATFMQSLGTVDLVEWASYGFSKEQLDVFALHLPTWEDALDFYTPWNRLSVKAAAFHEAGVGISESIAQKLAHDWIAMVQKATGGNPEHREAYLAVDRQREMWSPAERALIERADPYINELIEAYEALGD